MKTLVAIATACSAISAAITAWMGAPAVIVLLVAVVAFLATLFFGPTVIDGIDL